MKKISILIPCFNEVENVEGISKAAEEVLVSKLPEYDYEIDNNGSLDELREKAMEFLDLIFKKN